MAEPYNFPKHLREIVGEPLKNLGFKQKRCLFSRNNTMFKEKIYFTRDRFKNKGFKIFLIVNINFIDVTRVCLNYLRANTCPIFACAYYQAKDEDVMNTLNSFTDEQKMKFLEYKAQINWQYNSEEELKQVLAVALKEIKNTALPYFSNELNNTK